MATIARGPPSWISQISLKPQKNILIKYALKNPWRSKYGRPLAIRFSLINSLSK